MSGLKKTFEGSVTFLGVNSSLDQDLVSAALSEVQMTFAGFEGEDHGGLTRSACSRLRNVHPKGTPLKNQRQLTVLSVEEMAETADSMGIDTGIQPEWVGANLVLSG
ncbi:MAG: sulfurase, partial [Alphaproteobacteria bacterium]